MIKTETTIFCQDCEYEKNARCTFFLDLGEVSPHNGKPVDSKTYSGCDLCREGTAVYANTTCGKEAKWFKPRQPREDTWLERMFSGLFR